MSRTQNHTHKLKRHIYKSTGSRVFFCVLDCDYKIEVALALGKKCVCWRCGKDFRINEYSIRLARPTCSDCKKTKYEEVENTANELVTVAAEKGVEDLKSRLAKTVFHGQKDEDI